MELAIYIFHPQFLLKTLITNASFHLAAVVPQEVIDRVLEDSSPPAYEITNKQYPFSESDAGRSEPGESSNLLEMMAWAHQSN